MAGENESGGFTFEVLERYPSITLGKVSYFLSKQKVVQTNGSGSFHFVIKKQSVDEDGSPRGKPKQIFIPFDHAESLADHIRSVCSD